MASPSQQSQQHPSAELICDLARERRLSQLQEIDAFDAKAASMIGFAAIVLGLLFTSDLAAEKWNWVMTAASVVVGTSLVPLIAALWPRQYWFNPAIGALNRLALNRPREATAALVIASLDQAIRRNQPILDRKGRMIRWGTAMLVVGVLVAAARLIYSLETG